MTRDEIIRTLRESCDKDKQDAWQNGFWVITQEELERFAQLVSDEKVKGMVMMTHAEFKSVWDKAQQEEREEIAQFIESTVLGSLPYETAFHYAKLLKTYSTAIRARGDKHDI